MTMISPPSPPTSLTTQINSPYDQKYMWDGKQQSRLLPEDYRPSNYSVLLGRGKRYFLSVGNQRLRVTIKIWLQAYTEAQSKPQKSRIVSEIVDIIRRAGGDFVKQEGERWREVGDDQAHHKVSSIFRDLLRKKRCRVSQKNQDRHSTTQLYASHGATDHQSNLAICHNDPETVLLEPFLSVEFNPEHADCVSVLEEDCGHWFDCFKDNLHEYTEDDAAHEWGLLIDSF